MTTTQNPFRASLGTSPPLLVGRDEVIDDFRLGLEEGPGAHERISLLVGARGIGQTDPVSSTHLTLPTKSDECRSRWSPYH